MRRLSTISLALLVSAMAFGQISVNGTSPANLSTNVPLNTTVKIWFSAPLDTTKQFDAKTGYFTSIDTIDAQWYSANAETVYVSVRLQASTPYFILLFWVPGQGGATLASPYGIWFNTGSAFSGVNVSGTVSSSAPGVTPGGAFVALSRTPVGGGSDPQFVTGVIADGIGNFTLPYVPDGTFYPVAAKDVNGDGQIDPSKGDAIGVTPSITVSGTNVFGLSISLTAGQPMPFAAAVDSSMQFASAHLPGYEIRMVQSWETDSIGRALQEWQFLYYNPALDTAIEVRVEFFGTNQRPVDPWNSQQVRQLRALPASTAPADAGVFVANTEAAGGLTFRQQSVPGNWLFQRNLVLGQLKATYIGAFAPDTSQFYWGAAYQFYTQPTQDSMHVEMAKYFIGNYTTGDLIVVTGVNDDKGHFAPASYALNQNYPNPFNPATVISYQLPVVSKVRLTVYDVLGREVATLVNEMKPAGSYTARWNAAGFASGVYFYRIEAGKFTETRKLMLMK